MCHGLNRFSVCGTSEEKVCVLRHAFTKILFLYLVWTPVCKFAEFLHLQLFSPTAKVVVLSLALVSLVALPLKYRQDRNSTTVF